MKFFSFLACVLLINFFGAVFLASFCAIMVDTCVKTVTFRGTDINTKLSTEQVLSFIFVGLGVDAHQVDAVQFCLNRAFKVTFKSGALKGKYQREGVYVDGVHCPAIDGGPPTSLVLLHLFPYEGSHLAVKNALKQYGDIKEIRHQTHVSAPGVSTGTRLIRMVRKHHIPRHIKIDGYPCRIWYKDQPLVCDICSANHKASQCPLKGKCRRCRQPGHYARECKNPAWGEVAEEVVPQVLDPVENPTPAEASGGVPLREDPSIVCGDPFLGSGGSSSSAAGSSEQSGSGNVASAEAVGSSCVLNDQDSISDVDGCSQSILDEVPVSVDTRDNELEELQDSSSVMEAVSGEVDSQATPDDSAFVVPRPPRQSRSRRDNARGEGASHFKSRSRSGQGGRQGASSPSPGRHKMPQSVAATPPRRGSS